jgi:2-phospho-L-lactate guanylyltransferase
MRTAAILPVKRFTEAKQRLGVSVADPLRADLARAMVGDVLSALHRCAAIERTIVVTNEARVAAAAQYLGAVVVADTAEAGQSAAVALGVERARAEGFERVLCVPGDCPALDPAELQELLEPQPSLDGSASVPGKTALDAASTDVPTPADGSERGVARARDAQVTVMPDRHGKGTNGLLLAPPDAIEPSFGPDSCERHVARARASGARWQVEQVGSLLLDIDTGEDLDALRARLHGEQVQAPRTRAVLGSANARSASRAA